MKLIKPDLDVNIGDKKFDSLSPREKWVDIAMQCLENSNQGGVSFKTIRLVNKVIDKAESKAPKIELSDEEHKLLIDSMTSDDSKFKPSFHKVLIGFHNSLTDLQGDTDGNEN